MNNNSAKQTSGRGDRGDDAAGPGRGTDLGNLALLLDILGVGEEEANGINNAPLGVNELSDLLLSCGVRDSLTLDRSRRLIDANAEGDNPPQPSQSARSNTGDLLGVGAGGGSTGETVSVPTGRRISGHLTGTGGDGVTHLVEALQLEHDSADGNNNSDDILEGIPPRDSLLLTRNRMLLNESTPKVEEETKEDDISPIRPTYVPVESDKIVYTAKSA